MPERIETKAVLEKHTWEGALWNPDELRAAQTVGKELYAALAQEIADREGDRKKIKALEVIAADKVLLNEQVAVLEDDIEGYEEAIRGLLKRIAVLEARIEALESDKAAMRLEIVTIIGMYGDHMHPRVKQALEAVAVAYPPAALAAEEKRPLILRQGYSPLQRGWGIDACSFRGILSLFRGDTRERFLYGPKGTGVPEQDAASLRGHRFLEG